MCASWKRGDVKRVSLTAPYIMRTLCKVCFQFNAHLPHKMSSTTSLDPYSAKAEVHDMTPQDKITSTWRLAASFYMSELVRRVAYHRQVMPDRHADDPIFRRQPALPGDDSGFS